MAIEKKDKVSIKGKQVEVNANFVNDKIIVIRGKWLKIATIKDEVCDNGIENPEIIIKQLLKYKKADIFSFDQKLPDTDPKFNYYFEWDNLAVLKIENYDYWWNKQIKNDARRMVRKAEKNGVVSKAVPLTDELVKGIKGIYDESPMRQGKPFWHYKKDFETVKRENSTYLDRSEFIGAYCKGELIGFDKIFYTGNRADQIQLLSKMKHKDKSPTNALLSKAVEICAQKRIKYLTYGKYIYGNKGADPLSDFKKRNGFEKILIPRYYIPLTLKGKIAIKMGLQKNILDLLPTWALDKLINLRTKLYNFRYSRELKNNN